jgi:pimeloyl-ACP methyl ester carboxylesterase
MPTTDVLTGNPTTRTGTLPVPGARLHYEVRGSGPLVLLVGAPMPAAAFAPLADLLATDHTVLTTDPRGIGRSLVDDRTAESAPDLRADDLSRLIAHVSPGPTTDPTAAATAGGVAVFGSSGGAVSALALAQTHPDQVHTVIAHEPPLVELLPDRKQLRAQTEDCCETYLSGDVVGAWTKFFDQANITIPAQAVQQMFGGRRDPQVLADELFWFAHELRGSTFWQPQLDTLAATQTRIVIGVGQDSPGQLCDRTSQALAHALHTTPTPFPGGHIGFVDAPAPFAYRLRSVLTGS